MGGIATRVLEAIDRSRLGGWDSYREINYFLEAEVEAALKSTQIAANIIAFWK